VLTVALGFPAAGWAVSFGSMGAYEDGVRLAEASGGDVYNASGGITEKIRFRDLKADGDGAYGVARHQAYQYACNPGTNICYWAWRAVYEDQTDRYGTAYGWRTSYLHEEGHNAADWRTQAGICVDQSWEPDACGWKSYINP
jgi:hypothetical protein